MRLCLQCGRQTTIWKRDLWTGLCRQCTKNPKHLARLVRFRRLSFLTITLLVLVFSSISYATPLFFINRPFSSQEWLQGSLSDRGRMARDLASPERLPRDLPSPGKLGGKTRMEVHELLGRPDYTHGGSTDIYKIDIGYRWLIHPQLHELQVTYEKDKNETVAVVFID